MNDEPHGEYGEMNQVSKGHGPDKRDEEQYTLKDDIRNRSPVGRYVGKDGGAPFSRERTQNRNI